MNALAASLQAYFTTFAHTQRDLSANTITSYRDTWRLLLKHLTATLGVPADALDFDAITATNVAGFLDHLEHERGNSARTRNARLTAIRSVLARALPDHPEHAATITQVLAIPPKRTTRAVIEFLTTDEVDTLLAAPDATNWTGRRDHALLALTVQTGLRISEICSLTVDDVHLGAGPHVACTGKGRRQRVTPLTRAAVAIMTTYLAERINRPGTALFCGPHGQPLSRDALEHRLAKHLITATTTCPSLAGKHVTMHTLRHTAAMNLLAAGVDVSVIALWLGHADTHSTDAYLHADMAIKQAAIDRTRPPDVRPGTYQPEPDILAWLTAL
ncbi:tyrosine-type recombinase/integrase [Tenggerimyces flavus]|uniref:Tyrosine-type recombinase/integrase n=1 Tax=Tenggerimyces flavus TaxID=1708749 RepID=A0ABV7YPU3_9ACTN|nr:tyrosine-type recombinase/integrase [Tenggerimyces flavus]MBM7790019.1 site-specific recombinase XerD [Tenggerimyces flavus]MBM7790237.1 site-specific recombinase XerD [Tenggerimyces flavus]